MHPHIKRWQTAHISTTILHQEIDPDNPAARGRSLAELLGNTYVRSLDGVLWSIYCEITYYLLYPILVPLIFRYGSVKILIGSIVVSLSIITTDPTKIYLWDFGIGLTWLVNAPLWISGVVLACHLNNIEKHSRMISIWYFRFIAILLCCLTSFVAFNMSIGSIGYIWTIVFSLFCIFWVAGEISNADRHPPVQLFERFGLAGYSMYLTHKFVITLFDSGVLEAPVVVRWFGEIGLLAVSAFCFYRLVEWPAHKLARTRGLNARVLATS